jgi:hypothetical protein
MVVPIIIPATYLGLPFNHLDYQIIRWHIRYASQELGLHLN